MLGGDVIAARLSERLRGFASDGPAIRVGRLVCDS